MTTEFKRVFGPPGCGKTTWLAQQAKAAVEKFGADKVAISSFTRAAAVEIAGRDTGVQRQNVGTLHSLCFQAMGNPQLAELHIREWNTQAPAGWQLEAVGDDFDPYGAGERATGDKVYRRYQLLRAMKHPANQYPQDVMSFARAWDEWKCSGSYVDFTDLIDFGRRELDYAPGMPKALFVDEAQDLNPMQIELIEKWAQKTEWTIMVGDPDQAIYTWAGADPYAFYNAPSDQKFFPKSLQRSWRLPVKVHAWAQQWIRQIHERDNIAFRPRDAEGETIYLSGADWREPDELIRLALDRTAQNQTVAFLTTCGYMLDPLKKMLRHDGIPFYNPYRDTRGDWNPLQKIVERVTLFLRPCREIWGSQADSWTGPMLYRWSETIKSEGVFVHGAKAKIKRELKDVSRPLYTEVIELFEDGVFEEIMRRMETSASAACEWMLAHAINDTTRDRIAYPIRCIDRDPHSLFHNPKVIIGTGHSVKGADKIDTAIVFPDLSVEGERSWRAGGHLRDAVIRLLYVMATRARESLLLAPAAGELSAW